MASGLITPGLVLEVVEAGEDLVITSEEFLGIIRTVAGVFSGVILAVFAGMLIGVITEEFTKETGIKTKKIIGIPIPVIHSS